MMPQINLNKKQVFQRLLSQARIVGITIAAIQLDKSQSIILSEN